MIEKSPSVLSPFYEDAGNAAFSFTMYNPGREEVRGDLVMTLTNQETKEVFNVYLLTPNVVGTNDLAYSTFYYQNADAFINSSGKVGKLPKGKYDVTLSDKG